MGAQARKGSGLVLGTILSDPPSGHDFSTTTKWTENDELKKQQSFE